MEPQGEFDFNRPAAGPDGVEVWHRQRERTAHRLARRLGLPLDREVELWLWNGMRLRGRLQLRESMLFLETVDQVDLEMVIGAVNFRYGDIESCVRLD